MKLFRILPSFIVLLLIASPSFADWKTVQSNGKARAVYQSGNYEVWIHCRRGQGLELWLRDLTLSGRDFQNVRSLMMWVKLPDGRTDRWPVTVVQEGAGISGALLVSDFNLEFFRNAQSFELDSPQTRQVFLSGDMRGTGAARLAFLEQCGL
ncbi:hypothetical protein [Actibacterium lipolyticum]|uniref:Uncharacterized protein n=1 Tax=Actibacterium lipolyticum TaxID=1524263 RepID=A0A238KG26_9RHOB|nr:hypothetical protein [Actibacterium lipolyticum]SMX41587.1 hypothetical protein COL8621_01785 [Actibacterium lipolyticum]